MNGLFINLVIANLILIMGCPTVNKIERTELLELEKNGYLIRLDSELIKINFTYLDETNIRKMSLDKKRKQVSITRNNRTSPFYTVVDLRSKNNYPPQIDVITVNGLVLDSTMINQIKFEEGCVIYTRLLTQKDYERKDFNDLPQVKQRIGNGILIINTQ